MCQRRSHIEMGLGRLEELQGLGASVFLYVSDHAQQIQHNEQLNTAWTLESVVDIGECGNT